MLFVQLLSSLIHRGELILIDARGRTHRVGDPKSGPAVTIRLHDPRLHRTFLMNPRLAIGEAYMDGTLTVERGSIYDFLDLIGLNIGEGTAGPLDRWILSARRLWRRFEQANPLGGAQRNVAHHYDLSEELYRLFLDEDMQYSCAYFVEAGISLDHAQEAKKRHIAAKLAMAPGQKVLDIGSGWGGLALYLASTADVEVTGLTLSREQLRVAQARAEKAGLADRVHFHLRDYREERGTYDRIVSVGMFEHVGVPHYGEFFDTVYRLLRQDGVALLHTIAHRGPPSNTNAWLRKYIFPGGYCPAMSEILPVTERTGLWVTDVEVLRLHYAETLRHWRERFLANWDKAKALYDERFCRMWEFYLAGSEMAFRRQGHIVSQIQLAKTVDALPITRDYMVDWERGPGSARPAKRRLKSVG